MTFSRSNSILLLSLLFLICCKTTTVQYGQKTIENLFDTVTSKQEILKIRSLNNNVFDSSTFVGNEHIAINYRLFRPKSSELQYPLMVVFHGSGSIGTDNKSQLGILQKLFASPQIQNTYPAYVLAPQFSTRSSDYLMDSTRNVLTSVPRPCLNSVLQLIDSLKSTLNIDNKRIYVIGFSMGGSTVINALAARPDLFAAGISISGIPQFEKKAALSQIPIWLIHGIDDTENPIISDEQLYKEIGGSKNILFWKLKGIAHNTVFTPTILGNTLPEWLFKQHKK